MTEMQSRVAVHWGRRCPCCGNDPCDLVLDLDAHQGWTVPGMIHVDEQRRRELVILLENALASLETILATNVRTKWLREGDVLAGVLADLGEPQQEAHLPVDHGEVDITAEQMKALVRAPGQAMFDVLTRESTVEQAVDWANQLERAELGDAREGEDWVLTYRMRPSDAPVKLGEVSKGEEDEVDDVRAKFNELRRRFSPLEGD